MAFAVTGLRLSPEAFWRLGIRELQALASAAAANMPSAPGRRELEEMMANHPDTTTN